LLTNDKNPEYFITKKQLNSGQACSSKFKSGFDYKIVYRSWKSNGKVDTITRWPGDLPLGGDKIFKSMEQVVLKPQNVQDKFCMLADSPPTEGRPSISDIIAVVYVTGSEPGETLDTISNEYWVGKDYNR
jgi:hypothetical protein